MYALVSRRPLRNSECHSGALIPNNSKKESRITSLATSLRLGTRSVWTIERIGVKSDVERYSKPGQDFRRRLVRAVDRFRAVSEGELAGSIVELVAFSDVRSAVDGNERPNASVIPDKMILQYGLYTDATCAQWKTYL